MHAAIVRHSCSFINHNFSIDNCNLALYSYTASGHIADWGAGSCRGEKNRSRRRGASAGCESEDLQMKNSKSVGIALVVMMLLALTCGAHLAWGQEVTASITGTV